jgi:GAF domain
MSIMRIRKSHGGGTPPPAGPRRIEAAEDIRQSLASELFDDEASEKTDPLHFLLESMRLEKIRLVHQLDQSSRTSSRLATLYVAIERLHDSLQRAKVCEAIEDIVINVIGGEQCALFEVDSNSACLNLISSVGVDPEPLREVGFGEGLVGRVAASGRLFVKRDGDLNDCALWEDTLNACIPLKYCGRLTGVIAIFGMQVEKVDFTPIDIEMFELLTKHGALALHAAEDAAPRRKKKE